MLSQNYFNLVSHNVYDDLNYLQLGLQLAIEEYYSSTKKDHYNKRDLFFNISKHRSLFNSIINNDLIKSIYDVKSLMLKIRSKYPSFYDILNSKALHERSLISRIDNAYSYLWPDEFPTIGLYKNDIKLDKITVHDYSLFILKHMPYKKTEHIKDFFPIVYEYLMYLYPIPNDSDFIIPPVAGYLYLLENNIKEYPRTIITNKYAKYSPTDKRFCLFDNMK